MSNWITFTEKRPAQAGAYRWRLPSLAVSGIFVTFTAHMRMRGAGGTNVLSPVFDYWDGYRVLIPAGTQWQPLEEPSDCKWHDIKDVDVEGLAPRPCPYCSRTPRFRGITHFTPTGVSSSNPDRYNGWKMVCCAWGSTPEYSDPRELVAFREKAMSAMGIGDASGSVLLEVVQRVDAARSERDEIATLRAERDRLKALLEGYPAQEIPVTSAGDIWRRAVARELSEARP